MSRSLSQFLLVCLSLSCFSCSYIYTLTVVGTVVMPNQTPISHGTVTLFLDSQSEGEAPVSPNGEFKVGGRPINPQTTKDDRGVTWLDEGELSLQFDIDGRKFDVKNLKALADSSGFHFFCSATLVVDARESLKPDAAPAVDGGE